MMKMTSAMTRLVMVAVWVQILVSAKRLVAFVPPPHDRHNARCFLTTAFKYDNNNNHEIPVHATTALQALPTAEESAAALTNFMAKAHEEKIRAMQTVEEKYQAEISDLKAQVAAYEAASGQHGLQHTASADTTTPESNSFAFPATNKALAEKVSAHRQFLSDYMVNSQIEKVRAVHEAVEKTKAYYEDIIAKSKPLQ